MLLGLSDDAFTSEHHPAMACRMFSSTRPLTFRLKASRDLYAELIGNDGFSFAIRLRAACRHSTKTVIDANPSYAVGDSSFSKLFKADWPVVKPWSDNSDGPSA
jgi:hypothetical protein